MSRDDLLKSIGFGTDFINSLKEYEARNPEIVRPLSETNPKTVDFFDTQEVVISVSPPNYLNKITIKR